jgi:hypothetical protein
MCDGQGLCFKKVVERWGVPVRTETLGGIGRDIGSGEYLRKALNIQLDMMRIR